jgi:hypothetical protein
LKVAQPVSLERGADLQATAGASAKQNFILQGRTAVSRRPARLINAAVYDFRRRRTAAAFMTLQ